MLLRHGDTNYPGRYIGSRDVPLSAAGVDQITALRDAVQEMKIDRILASPMLRCRQTCELLLPSIDITWVEELREIDFGDWEGLSFSEIVAKDPTHVEQWADWSLDFCFPGGESIGHFVRRMQKVGKHLAGLAEKNIMVISHGGVLRALLCHYLGLAPEKYLLFQVEKGRFSTLQLHGELGVLTGLNVDGN